MESIFITRDVLDSTELKNQLPKHPSCGAVFQFEGVVRNRNEGKNVAGIEYECFEEMAKKELKKIIEEAKEKWGVHQIFLAHRMGRLDVGEISLILFVAAPHRREAFEASQYIIDELKQRAPIWKKEFYVNGQTQWVECHHS
jgi:molybdopterin synthase catalytic subunit